MSEKEETDVEAAANNVPGKLWRDLVSYWIFGLCNNFGYVVMLTAAHSIIKDLNGGEVRLSFYNRLRQFKFCFFLKGWS